MSLLMSLYLVFYMSAKLNINPKYANISWKIIAITLCQCTINFLILQENNIFLCMRVTL